MTDTVGFVRHLPHQLVEAFRSTLEEVADADLVLHVVDGSHPDPEGQIAAVREVFAEIGADKVPEIVVVNKADAADPMVLARLRQREPHASSSRQDRRGHRRGADASSRPTSRGPASSSRRWCRTPAATCIDRLHQHGEIESLEHTGDGTVVRVARTPTWPASSRRTPSSTDPGLWRAAHGPSWNQAAWPVWSRSTPDARSHGPTRWRPGSRRRCSRGSRFRHVFRGFSVAADAPDSPFLRVEAALLLFDGAAVASHRSAARVHGVPLPPHPLEHVSVPTATLRRRPGGVRCHVCSSASVVVVRGLRVSDPRQMFVELAPRSSRCSPVAASPACRGGPARRGGRTTVADAPDAPWWPSIASSGGHEGAS